MVFRTFKKNYVYTVRKQIIHVNVSWKNTSVKLRLYYSTNKTLDKNKEADYGLKSSISICAYWNYVCSSTCRHV
ncbi:hypothetical protein STP4a_103 [Salmonella phage STP4-a]|uniref:Uncharacterized protein n=1 Tax=Salmonella phage STP4-a TaxID=1445860 RepID=A0A0B4LA95_9CAUD|nr:hypothetical protein STP4a_103 [Salmonella phage STP4-a]AHJ86958.1 hypothetical protein STP4a_103 [Salmonella phage STP4-a]